MLIFAIETSCDETATAILEFDKNGHFKILENQVSSQVNLHAEWGGVVPNLAAREHSKNIVPLIEQTLKQSKIDPKNIDLFCVTAGPGLIPALLVGVNVAKTLSYFYQKPLIGVHHIEGHIYSNYIEKNRGDLNQFEFPVLNLVISGGHTQLILMKDHLQYEIIGETQDDAVGEAFDKVAKMMGLGYPGGPIISDFANKAEELIKNKKADKKYLELEFPRPMLHSKDLNFSFSGLKTSVLYFYQKIKEEANKKGISNLSKVRGKTEQRTEFTEMVNGVSRGGFDKEICQICDSNEKELRAWKPFIAKAFQDAVVEVLTKKTFDAIEIHQPKTVLLSGGVSANSKILENIKNKLAEEFPKTVFNAPEKSLCGDNASMIAVAGIARYLYGNKKSFEDNWKNLEANSGLKLN